MLNRVYILIKASKCDENNEKCEILAFQDVTGRD